MATNGMDHATTVGGTVVRAAAVRAMQYGKSLPHAVVEEDSTAWRHGTAPFNERGRHLLGGTGAATTAQDWGESFALHARNECSGGA